MVPRNRCFSPSFVQRAQKHTPEQGSVSYLDFVVCPFLTEAKTYSRNAVSCRYLVFLFFSVHKEGGDSPDFLFRLFFILRRISINRASALTRTRGVSYTYVACIFSSFFLGTTFPILSYWSRSHGDDNPWYIYGLAVSASTTCSRVYTTVVITLHYTLEHSENL